MCYPGRLICKYVNILIYIFKLYIYIYNVYIIYNFYIYIKWGDCSKFFYAKFEVGDAIILLLEDRIQRESLDFMPVTTIRSWRMLDSSI